jgi:hypothetical protein
VFEEEDEAVEFDIELARIRITATTSLTRASTKLQEKKGPTSE